LSHADGTAVTPELRACPGDAGHGVPHGIAASSTTRCPDRHDVAAVLHIATRRRVRSAAGIRSDSYDCRA
jgi:hypothetical protein